MDAEFFSSQKMDVFFGEIERGMIALKIQGKNTLHIGKAIQVVKGDPKACHSSSADRLLQSLHRDKYTFQYCQKKKILKKGAKHF